MVDLFARLERVGMGGIGDVRRSDHILDISRGQVRTRCSFVGGSCFCERRGLMWRRRT